jgi:hypothetical protein
MTQDQEEPRAGFGGVFKRGLGGVFNQAKVAKIRMDITALNGRKQDRFADIGKKVYALYESGLVRNAELLDLCSYVRQLDLEIADKEHAVAELRFDEDGSGAMPPAPYEGGIEEAPDPGTI